MAQNKVLGYEVSDWSVIALVSGLIVVLFLILHEINQLPKLASDSVTAATNSFWGGVFAPITGLWNTAKGWFS